MNAFMVASIAVQTRSPLFQRSVGDLLLRRSIDGDISHCADLTGRHPVDRTPPFPLPYLSSPSRPSFPSPFPCPRLWCDFRPGRNQKLLTRRLKIGEKYQGAAARSFPSPRTSALPRSPSCGIRLNRLCLPKRLRSRRRNPVTLRAGSHPLNLSTATERPPSWT